MDETAPEDIRRLLAQLRREFLAELPDRIATIESLILDGGREETLCREVHSLKGLGGTHGIDILSFACHQFEEALARTTDTDRRLAYVDVLRRIQALGEAADGQAESLHQRLQALRDAESGPAAVTDLLLVEPSAAQAAMLRERLADLPLRLDHCDDGLTALELYLHRHHGIVITAGEPRRLPGAALVAAVRHCRGEPLCLLVSGDGRLDRAASGGADQVLARDRELPDRLHRRIRRHLAG